MQITHTINMDLAHPQNTPKISLMQDDRYSRHIIFSLMENGVAWYPPEDASAIVRYEKTDGTAGGNYDTLPDGEVAYRFEGNNIDIVLAPQVCAAPGEVKLAVALISGNVRLHTFAITIDVERNPGLSAQSENYYKVTGSVADSGWSPNMFLGTDEDGNVVEVQGAVKTVNGVAPDENGNVNLEGGTGGVGADGFSPIATVTQTDTGATISITDKSGTTTATIANGKDGAKGDKGDTGAQGNPGKDGANGKDGVSATHSWNGTTLTITSASGTSSANLKGDKGDKGDQGIQGETGAKGDTGEQGPQGIQGPKGDTGVTGATGAAGYTPVRGTDYWTEADKAEIVAAVIESLGGNPVFGYVDEHNNIIVSGSLADGTYSVKYEMEDGSTVDIGDLVLDSNVYYSVANNLTDCTSDNSATQAIGGQSYSATITANSGYELSSIKVTMGGTDISSTAVSGGKITIPNVTGNIVITATATEIVVTPTYTNLFDPSKATINQRYNSSGALTAQDGYVAINIDGIGGYTPFTADTKIYMKGASFNDGDGKARISTFKTSGEDTSSANRVSSKNYNTMTFIDEGNGVESVSGVSDAFVSGVVRMAICPKVSSSAITANDIANIIITIGEPIG